MAASSGARAMACFWLPRLRCLRWCELVALLALNIDAVRLDAGATASDGSVVAVLATRTPSAPDIAATRAQRDKDLRAAANYLNSVGGAQDYPYLGNVKDILERLEDIRERVLFVGAARDPRHRFQIRKILRDVKDLGEALRARAGKLEAEGQIDDGGDELPTQRNNICSRISEYGVDSGFLGLVQLFCESLDTVRKAVDAGEDEEPMVYTVSGLWVTMVMKPDYRRENIDMEIERVLGEERRWLAKQLAPRPAGTEGTRNRTWALCAWETHIWGDAEVDTAAVAHKALKETHDVLLNATVEDDLPLSSVNTRIHHLEFCRARLVRFISRSDPAFREQIREVFHEVDARMHALRTLATRKLAAGEVDNSAELLISQRDSIRAKLEAVGLEQEIREDVRKICETFDRLHVVVKIELEKDRCTFEVLGRMAAIRRRPGYSDMPLASELDDLLAEEWGWLGQQEAVIAA